MSPKKISVLAVLAFLAAFPALGSGGPEFKAELSGDNEVPPVMTDGSGEAKFEVDLTFTSIEFELEVDNGTGIFGAAGAHIHCAPAGQNGPVVVFLAGAVAGGGFNGDVEIKATFTASNIINTACGATIADLVQAFRDGRVYANVHTPANPSGEIRGQLEEDAD